MAIPAVPSSFFTQTQNSQNLVSWAITPTATSYLVNRSLDGVTYTLLTTLTGSPLATSYLDVAVTRGTAYFYQVAASNTDGQSAFTTGQLVIPANTSEMSLQSIRLASQQKADRVNSNFVTMPEWNTFINLAMYELYDLLIDVYEKYNVATPYSFVSDGTTFLYPLPDGITSYNNGLTNAPGYVPAPFYKLLGVDLGLQTANNAYVTIDRFNFNDRNRFVYPNTASTIYGVFNLQYEIVGSNIMFIPTPSAGQQIRIWFIPRLRALLQDTDISDISISGWITYVIQRAAKYALDKEESSTATIDAELLSTIKRIEASASNRDAGMPHKITDLRQNGNWSGSGSGWNGPIGGF